MIVTSLHKYCTSISANRNTDCTILKCAHPQNRKKRYLSKIDTRGLTAKKKGDLKIINKFLLFSVFLFEKQNDFNDSLEKIKGKDQKSMITASSFKSMFDYKTLIVLVMYAWFIIKNDNSSKSKLCNIIFCFSNLILTNSKVNMGRGVSRSIKCIVK